MLFFIYYKLQKYEKYSYLSLFFLLCHFLLLILHAFLDMGELILGILCGIALSLFFSFGPAFFSQIRMSIQYGYRKSYPFAFGVSASDIIIVFLMLTVLKNVDLYELLHNVWVASIGGFVLVLMGFYYLKKEVKTYEDKQSKIKFKSIGGDPRRRTIFMQGFVINLANPLIWIYWVSVIALLTGELNLTVAERYIFFVGVLGSTLGLVLVVNPGGLTEGGDPLRGVLFGLAAAALYATVILMNKRLTRVSGIDRTVLQFGAAAAVLLPYILLTTGFHFERMDAPGWLCLLAVCLIHSALAYILYFSALRELPGQEAAVLSYIDPLVAVLISLTVLAEPVAPVQLVGGAMILAFTLANEL